MPGIGPAAIAVVRRALSNRAGVTVDLDTVFSRIGSRSHAQEFGRGDSAPCSNAMLKVEEITGPRRLCRHSASSAATLLPRAHGERRSLQLLASVGAGADVEYDQPQAGVDLRPPADDSEVVAAQACPFLDRPYRRERES